MGGYQKFKGDPETKLFYLLNNFVGGINTEFSDDNSSDVDFENIINFDMDKLGTLNKRNGFGELSVLSNIIGSLKNIPVVSNRTEEDPNPEESNNNLVYLKLLKNDNNCFRNLSSFSGQKGYREYQKQYGFQNNEFILLMITSDKEDYVTSNAWYIKCTLPELEYTENDEIIDTIQISCFDTSLPITFKWDRTLMNMDSIEYYSNIWFTNNYSGLVRFDRNAEINSNEDLKNAFHYVGNIVGYENEAFKPSITDIVDLGLGANLLCSDPITDIKSIEGVSESLNGAFLTTLDRRPIEKVIPVSEPLLLHIFYTGSSDFTITAKCGGVDIKLNLAYYETYSTEGKKVYEVRFVNNPNGEVEFKIAKNVSTVEPFIFYVTTGKLSPDLEPVKSLNIGEFGMYMTSDNRVIYYKDDTMYFSDINRPNYIPATSYLKLPIEPTDKITKIVYFKGISVVFTKEKIYKIIGTWRSEDFRCEPINTSLGCHAGNTVVPIEDTLYFASPRGLFALKSNTFVEGMQNLKELDLKVKKLTSDFTKYDKNFIDESIRFNGISEKAYALRYRDKYLLFYNNYGDKNDYAAVNDIDVLAYQYEMGNFTTYRFAEKPTFLYLINGVLQTLATVPKLVEDSFVSETECDYNFLLTGTQGLAYYAKNATPSTPDIMNNDYYGLKFKDNADRLVPFPVQIPNGFTIDFITKFNELNGGAIISSYLLGGSEEPIMSIKNIKTTDSILFNLVGFEYYSPEGLDLLNIHKYRIKVDYEDTIVYCSLYKDNMLVDKKQLCKVSELSFLKRNYDAAMYLGADRSTKNVPMFNGELHFIMVSDDKGTSLVKYNMRPKLFTTADLFFDKNTVTNYIGEATLSVLENGVRAAAKNIAAPYVFSAVKLDNKYLGKNIKLSANIKTSGNRNTGRIALYFGNTKLPWTTSVGITLEDSGSVIGTVPSTMPSGCDSMYILFYATTTTECDGYDYTDYTDIYIEEGDYCVESEADYDKIRGLTSTLYVDGLSDFILNTGVNLNGYDEYIRLPELNLDFSNELSISFEGKFFNKSKAKIIDLATSDLNNNHTISVYIDKNTIGFYTVNNKNITTKMSKEDIDLEQNHRYKISYHTYTEYDDYIELYVDDKLVETLYVAKKGLYKIYRDSNFIGKSNDKDFDYLKGNIKNLTITNWVPEYEQKLCVFEYDISATDFGKPMYLELETKSINMKYPQHLKKLKHIFVKSIGGYSYNEFFFELYGDDYLINNPKEYYVAFEEDGSIILDYSENKMLNINEKISILNSMQFDHARLGEGNYQTKKLVIPSKAKNFKCKIYGDSSDYLSFESFGFVCKLGKVKER